VHLVDEQDVARAQVGEDGRQVARPLDRRAGRHLEPYAHLVAEGMSERRFAESGRAVEQHVVQRLLAGARRVDQDPEVLPQAILAQHFVERARPQRRVYDHFFRPPLG